MMQSFQAAFDLNLREFVQWTCACIGGYAAYLDCPQLQEL